MKKNKSKSSLLGGALVGAALGVAAGMFFAPKSGKKLRKDVQNQVADFQKFISPKIKGIKKMSDVQYKTFIKTAIIQYSKLRKLSAKDAKELAGYAQEFWKHFKKHF
jgi:gas vesicle protein